MLLIGVSWELRRSNSAAEQTQSPLQKRLEQFMG